ncbi:hypothetical protein B0H65DRAFT_473158 [Neurospora tetraspora]|uniref:Uncharacterized protein n=1 Tax=Neurospora tetraspora TaxID=94610 RepID=A0AAE0MPZ3_9PEZI|nr:hypothetical protein B0H65DRAFT_473158 [Neurospora tetraspora]
MPVSFATVPSRIWMPAMFLPFSFSLLVSVRMSRPFSRSLSPEWGFPNNTTHLTQTTGPGPSPGQAFSRLPPCHLRRQVLYHYVSSGE